MREYKMAFLIITVLLFQLSLTHSAYAQTNIQEKLNIKIDESIGFQYLGSKKDDVGNTEYFFQSNFESDNTSYDIILNIMDPVYYNTDSEILDMIKGDNMEGTEFEGLEQQRVRRSDKILLEYPTVESLADDNQIWQLKTGYFVYKKRLYWLFVGSREKKANRLYECIHPTNYIFRVMDEGGRLLVKNR